MIKFKKTLAIATILMLIVTMLPTSVFAAGAGEKIGSYTASLSKTSVTVGGSSTLTITAKKAAGQFTVTSSNPSVAKVTTSTIWVDGSHANASGKVSIKAVAEGTATITITPTSVSDQNYNLLTNTKTIKITVKKAATNNNTNTDKKPTTTTVKSSDATLKSLTSSVINIPFSKDKTSYTVNVDKTVTSLGLKAVANHSKAKVTITGDKDFVTGNNVVTVKVTAENGTTKTYTVTVIKSKYGSGPLLSLKVNGYEMLPEFDPSIHIYSINVVDKTKVDVEYVLADADSKVTIEGVDDLKEGINTIKVIVTEKNGKVTTYTINANVTLTKGNGIIWWIIIILIVLVLAEAGYIVLTKKGIIQKASQQATKRGAKQTTAKKAAEKTDKQEK